MNKVYIGTDMRECDSFSFSFSDCILSTSLCDAISTGRWTSKTREHAILMISNDVARLLFTRRDNHDLPRHLTRTSETAIVSSVRRKYQNLHSGPALPSLRHYIPSMIILRRCKQFRNSHTNLSFLQKNYATFRIFELFYLLYPIRLERLGYFCFLVFFQESWGRYDGCRRWRCC